MAITIFQDTKKINVRKDEAKGSKGFCTVKDILLLIRTMECSKMLSNKINKIVVSRVCQYFSIFIGISFVVCNISAARASLIDSGNGLIYDDILDISWLKDANLAESNTFGVSGIAVDGTMNWYTAFDWIDALNSNNYMGYSTWRMPTLTPVDGVSFDYTVSYDGSTDRGFNNTSTSNELSNLYYSSLGNLGLCTTSNVTGSPADSCEETSGGLWGLQNTDHFRNLTASRYWTDVKHEEDSLRAFDMDFTFGQMGTGGKEGNKIVWAVLDGNVSAVPVPAAIWLFGSGLIGISLATKRKSVSVK